MLAANFDWNAPADFHVVTDLTADPPRVAVWGELDLGSVAALRDALSEALETGARRLVVDLRHVTFMGSTGIRELVRARREIDHIEVRVTAPIVRRALMSASLDDSFAIVD